MKVHLSRKRLFYWLPRILSVLFIVFVSVFALDVLGQPQWPLALLIHLIPSFILAVITAIAWRNEKVGGFLFIVVGFVTLFFFHFESLIITVPTIIIGILFIL